MVRLTAVLVMVVSLGAQETRYSSAWDLVKGEHDKDGDGKVSAAEYSRGEARFARLDSNGDGFITESEVSASSRGRGGRGGRGGGGAGGRGGRGGRGGPGVSMSEADRQARMLVRLLGATSAVDKPQVDAWFVDLDKNQDKKLVEAELTCVSDTWRKLALRRLDGDKDGGLGKPEIAKAYAAADKDGDGKLSTKELGGGGAAASRGGRGGGRARGPAPTAGQAAPDFTLKTLDGKATHTLSSFKGKKPVALIFGSYT